MSPSPLDARRAREKDIVDAARALFDERGHQDAPVEEIARAVGINKALIYRHFSGKDELFVLTVTHYLDEVAGEIHEALAGLEHPEDELRAATDVFAGFCLRYPAFLDAALSLMRRPFAELRDVVSDGVLVRLGAAMAASLEVTSDILRRGAASGAFAVEDPDFTANHLYTQTLGTMHLARVGVGVRRNAAGLPEPFGIDPQRVRAAAVRDALNAVRP